MTIGRQRFRVFQSVFPIERAQLPRDVLAGLTLAALAIPEVMGYTQIAGVPVVVGLYTMLLPMFLFAMFGSSRQLVVGADSATAAMLATALAGIAVSGSDEYLSMASTLALIVGGMLLLARILNLGVLANFLSRTVLIGFLSGVGIQVAVGQVPGMLGIHSDGLSSITHLLLHWPTLETLNVHTLVVSLSTLIAVVGMHLVSKRFPGALVAVIGAIFASWLFQLEEFDIALVGSVPSGLPSLQFPLFNLTWEQFTHLLPTAFAMVMVILAQSSATSRAYAARHQETVNDNQDLVGLGLANIGAAVSGAFVVNGSPTKTQMVDGAGGRSQLAHLITALIVLLMLVLFTEPLAYLPHATLASIVFLIGFELIDIKGLRKVLYERPWEFWVSVVTMVAVVVLGVQLGILVAIALSLLVHTRHGYRPVNSVVISNGHGRWRAVPLNNNAQLMPGLQVYRFTHGMYYANASLMSREVLYLVNSARPSLEWFCIDAAAVDDVDYTAAQTLVTLSYELRKLGVRLVFAEVTDRVRYGMDRSGITQAVGEEAYFSSVSDVVEAFSERPHNIPVSLS
ncbi:SulP family inorganic anion transporter [Marinomonas fungiae]|uniref:Sulfate permease or related transporter, MFS superfamily n=1 Tax=Marinomonas fungiae TaxID=1137284 RepID=A0A0K6IM76_9GAMM|nr:SulP family inorganic anion transporter [Marinomonas fungiae]CUB04194.1 Sulfate permease or related transporter, MFS superfamily [Marinomonas fungiae]